MALLPVFIASLLGSAHCAGMCGGFVAFYSGQSDGSYLPHVGYNTGRLLTYILLGTLAGYLGQSLDNAGALIGVQRITAIVTGALLIFWGLKGLMNPTGVRFEKGVTYRVYEKLRSLFRPVFRDSNTGVTGRAFLLGTLSTFLPCGWLYTFAALAAASGSAANGAAVMAVFWLGTLPALITIAGISRILSSKLRQHIPRITAALLLIAGVLSFYGHVGLSHNHSDPHHHHAHH